MAALDQERAAMRRAALAVAIGMAEPKERAKALKALEGD
jgi:hypothetical protein